MAMGALQQILTTGTITNMQTPLSAETIQATDDLILHLKTTGTATTATFTDPGLTASGSVATNPTVVMGATQERFIFVQATLANPSTGNIAVAFSGALTGVTAEWLRM